jgi:hypothetical protein
MVLDKDRKELVEQRKKLWEENLELKIDIETMKIIAGGLVIALVIATGFIGVLLWH